MASPNLLNCRFANSQLLLATHTEEGRLIFDGPLHELVKSRNPFVREFLE
jgi:hypothetical protein